MAVGERGTPLFARRRPEAAISKGNPLELSC